MRIICGQLKAAPIEDARWDSRSDVTWKGNRQLPDPQKSFYFGFDVGSPTEFDNIYMMLIYKQLRGWDLVTASLQGLLLQPTDGLQGQYRRLGVFETHHSSSDVAEVIGMLPGLSTIDAMTIYAHQSEMATGTSSLLFESTSSPPASHRLRSRSSISYTAIPTPLYFFLSS